MVEKFHDRSTQRPKVESKTSFPKIIENYRVSQCAFAIDVVRILIATLSYIVYMYLLLLIYL